MAQESAVPLDRCGHGAIFARENGFTIYAIEGISSADQPSSKKVAEIIATIKAQGVKAIFTPGTTTQAIIEWVRTNVSHREV